MVTVTVQDYDAALVEALAEHYTLVRPRPRGYGITASEYAKVLGISRTQARQLLERAVSDGVLTRSRMRYNGTVAVIYHQPEEVTDA